MRRLLISLLYVLLPSILATSGGERTSTRLNGARLDDFISFSESKLVVGRHPGHNGPIHWPTQIAHNLTYCVPRTLGIQHRSQLPKLDPSIGITKVASDAVSLLLERLSDYELQQADENYHLVRGAFKLAAQQWEAACGVHFVDVDDDFCDDQSEVWLRVIVSKVVDRANSWSVVGLAEVFNLMQDYLSGEFGQPMKDTKHPEFKPWMVLVMGKARPLKLATRSRNTISLDPSATNDFVAAHDIFLHEIGHFLGFYHEFAVSGRQDHGCVENHDTLINLATPVDGEFQEDIDSVMHYKGCGGTQQRLFRLSAGDIEMAAKIYGPPSPSKQKMHTETTHVELATASSEAAHIANVATEADGEYMWMEMTLQFQPTRAEWLGKTEAVISDAMFLQESERDAIECLIQRDPEQFCLHFGSKPKPVSPRKRRRCRSASGIMSKTFKRSTSDMDPEDAWTEVEKSVNPSYIKARLLSGVRKSGSLWNREYLEHYCDCKTFCFCSANSIEIDIIGSSGGEDQVQGSTEIGFTTCWSPLTYSARVMSVFDPDSPYHSTIPQSDDQKYRINVLAGKFDRQIQTRIRLTDSLYQYRGLLEADVQTVTLLSSEIDKGAVHHGVVVWSSMGLHNSSSVRNHLDSLLSSGVDLSGVDLSRNDLSNVVDITSVLSTATNITIVDLSENKLSGDPSGDFALMKSLNILRLVGNSISAFEILRFPRLEELDLSQNKLTAFPPLRELPMLRILRLAGNQIQTLPHTFSDSCPMLQELNIADNAIKVLPSLSAPFLPKALTAVDVSNNLLTALPSLELKSVKSLRAQGNRIADLLNETLCLCERNDAGLCDFRLEELDLSYNLMENLSKHAFSYCQSLQRVDMSFNKLKLLETRLPQSLMKLNLKSNGLTSIAPSAKLCRTHRLVELRLENNALIELANDCADESTRTENGGQAVGWQALKILGLRKNRLVSMSPWLVLATQLVHLDLSFNDLQRLPSQISNLVNLVNVDVSHNKLTILPSDFHMLPLVKSLDLSYNNFTSSDVFSSIPSKALFSLALSNNKIGALPTNLGSRFAAVGNFNMSNNLIREIALPGFRPCTKLRVLDISNNLIESMQPFTLPESAIEVYAQNNRLTGAFSIAEQYLASRSKQTTSLHTLDLSGNMITQIDLNYGARFPELSVLRLNDNRLYEVGSRDVRTTDRLPWKLAELDLRNNNLTDESAKPLFRLLQRSHSGIEILRMQKAFQFRRGQDYTNRTAVIDYSWGRSASIPHGTLIFVGRQYSEVFELDELENATGAFKLNFAMNRVSHLPKAIPRGWHRLRYINLSYNNLQSLPQWLFTIPVLKTLNLAHNFIQRLPDLSNVTSGITEISLTGNLLTSLPSLLAVAFPKLDILAVDHTKLSSLPTELPASLVWLQLGATYVSDMSPLCTARSLQYLQIYSTSVARIPECFHELPLDYVELGVTALRAFPTPVTSMTNSSASLIDLRCVLCTFHYVPWDRINRMNQFNCPHCDFLDGNVDLSMGSNLKVISITDAKLKTFPKLPSQVETLTLQANGLEDTTGISQAKFVKKLILSKQNLTQWPVELNSLTHVQYLDLSENSIADIPHGAFDHMPNLRRLSLQGNKLQRFPNFPSNVTKLMRANFGHNRLKVLPEMPNVTARGGTQWILSDNDIHEIHDSWFCASPETTIIVDNNRLSSLPNCEFKQAVLSVRNNSLTTIPPLMKTSKIAVILVGNNPLRPGELDHVDFSNARRVDAVNCSLRAVPRDLCNDPDSRRFAHLDHNPITRPPEGRCEYTCFDCNIRKYSRGELDAKILACHEKGLCHDDLHRLVNLDVQDLLEIPLEIKAIVAMSTGTFNLTITQQVDTSRCVSEECGVTRTVTISREDKNVKIILVQAGDQAFLELVINSKRIALPTGLLSTAPMSASASDLRLAYRGTVGSTIKGRSRRVYDFLNGVLITSDDSNPAFPEVFLGEGVVVQVIDFRVLEQ